MSQSASTLSGVPSRYRLYLAISPILCVADAAGMVIRVVCHAVAFGISPRIACQMAVIERSDSDDIGSEGKKGADNLPLQVRTWPRWIFFVMGPLPAAVKLCSFSGMPWTKAFGIMFVASFAVTELLTALARSKAPPKRDDESSLVESAMEPQDVHPDRPNAPSGANETSMAGSGMEISDLHPSVFRNPFEKDNIIAEARSVLETPDPSQNGTSISHEQINEPAVPGPSTKAPDPDERNTRQITVLSKLIYRLITFDSILFSLALLTHVTLMLWAGEQMRLALPPLKNISIDAYHALQWIVTIAILALSGHLAIVFALWLGLWMGGYLPREEKSVFKRILVWVFKALIFTSVMSPDLERHEAKNRESTMIPPPPTWFHSIKLVCLPWAYLGLVGYVGYLGMTQVCKRWPLVGRVLLIERVEKKAHVANTVEGGGIVIENEKGPVDIPAWLALCFFFTNLTGYVLWYAYMYDSSGTVNPDWTDIFG